MSKQLTFSAMTAVLTMALFAASADAGQFGPPKSGQFAGHAPLLDLNARF
ncbi:hypothetical protein [Qipengyuania psychrotolerans]|uniref:Uncharacterized protein n=1 Tax=Qipengyuania psychrotolerans TaxID=2867238 RepID=A0ABX8ZEF8_9SPHN|nr:hypothetical protein [Qipengyuania psychrotolerans]QZD87390.1 hypothetical protein K3166_01360 [Qipengyuania psychrotolerans]